MNLIYQSGFLKALGWSLADSLWQMGLIWLLYTAITGNGRKRNAAQRHDLALLSLAGGSAWFIAGLFMHLFSVQPLPAQGEAFARHSLVSAFMDGIAPYFSIAYLVALLFLIARFLYQYQQSLRLFHTGIQEPDASLAAFVEDAAHKMGIPRKVVIGLSAIADTPLTIGFWKPMILFPIAAFNQLSMSQAEAIIVHELHHIRRNDYLINLLLALIDIFLFFNPFARILSSIVKKERENSCDDKVIQLQYNPHQYGQALLILEQNRLSHNNISIAATGKSAPMLLNRIKRLASHKAPSSPVLGKLSVLLLFLLLATSIQKREETVPVLAPSFTRNGLQVSFVEAIDRPAETFAFNGMETTASIISDDKNPNIENGLSPEKTPSVNPLEPSSPAPSAEKQISIPSTSGAIKDAAEHPSPEKQISASSQPRIRKIAGVNKRFSNDVPEVETKSSALLQALKRDLQALNLDQQALDQYQQALDQYQQTWSQHQEKILEAIEERNLINAGIDLNELPMTISIRQLIKEQAGLLLEAAKYKALEAQIAQANYPSFASYPALTHTLSAIPVIQSISLSGKTIALIGQDGNIHFILVNPAPSHRPHNAVKILKTVHL